MVCEYTGTRRGRGRGHRWGVIKSESTPLPVQSKYHTITGYRTGARHKTIDPVPVNDYDMIQYRTRTPPPLSHPRPRREREQDPKKKLEYQHKHHPPRLSNTRLILDNTRVYVIHSYTQILLDI